MSLPSPPTHRLTPVDWHARFCQQAGWTRHLRQHLFERAGLPSAHRVLEVGCGTGAILADGPAPNRAGEPVWFGVDINPDFLALAMRNSPASCLALAEALALPFPSASFDLTFCHFLLLWLPDPLQALVEMARLTRPGGAVLALAEPDYGGRIDFPPHLQPLGRWQAQALLRQGADPHLGRKLASLCAAAGLSAVESGVLGAQWSAAPDASSQAGEWRLLRADLEGMVDPGTLDRLQALDSAAWQSHQRVLFVPTFYAWGKVT
jgi:SAM-dependent methyltransferase